MRVGADWTYYGRNYAYYAVDGTILSVGKETAVAEPWKIPAASQLDMNASYRFKFGKLDAVLSGNVNNLLNYQYISKASTQVVRVQWLHPIMYMCSILSDVHIT